MNMNIPSILLLDYNTSMVAGLLIYIFLNYVTALNDTKDLKYLKMHKCLYHVLHYETEIWNFPAFKGNILTIKVFLFLYTTTPLTSQLLLGALTDGERKNLKKIPFRYQYY